MLFPKKQQCFILWICVLNPALYFLKKTGFNRKSCTCTLVKTMICVFCISSLNVIIYFSKNTHNFYSQKNNKSTIPIFRGGGAMCRRYYKQKKCHTQIRISHNRYQVFHEKGTFSYLCALGIDMQIISIARVYTTSTFYMKSAVVKHITTDVHRWKGQFTIPEGRYKDSQTQFTQWQTDRQTDRQADRHWTNVFIYVQCSMRGKV